MKRETMVGDVVNLILAIWLFLSPWLVGFSGLMPAAWAAWLTAIAVAIFAIAALSALDAKGRALRPAFRLRPVHPAGAASLAAQPFLLAHGPRPQPHQRTYCDDI